MQEQCIGVDQDRLQTTSGAVSFKGCKQNTMDVLFLQDSRNVELTELWDQVTSSSSHMFDKSKQVGSLVQQGRLYWDVLRSGLPASREVSEVHHNYFTSLWLEPRPTELIELATNYDQRFSGDFFAEFLLTQPISWRWFIQVCQFMLGSSGYTNSFTKIIRKSITQSSDVNSLDKRMLNTMNCINGFTRIMAVFTINENIKLSAEEDAIVKDLFNISEIPGSEVAMFRCWEVIDLETNSFNVLTEANSACQHLIGYSVKDLAEIMKAGSGLYYVEPLYWIFDRPYWEKIGAFMLGSIFKQPTWMTDVIGIRDAQGERIDCLVHMFASYEEASGTRSAITVTMKPFSPTFDPSFASEQEKLK
jgi:hypothetical protein